MTQRIEVSAIAVCARCKGRKIVTETSKIDGGTIVLSGGCPACGGTGETRTVVTCAGCARFTPDVYEGGAGWCDEWRRSTLPREGCSRWTAKGAQDGN